MRVTFCTAMLALLIVPLAQGAGVQKWVDENGNVHYGEQAPPTQQSQPVTGNLSVVGSSASQTVPVLYATSWCGYCKKARAFLQCEGIRFREYDIEKDARARARYESMGGRGVPLLVVGKERLQGFSVARYKRLFESAQTK